MFWIGGALALGRLAFSPEIGDFGHRYVMCVLGAWLGTAIGIPFRQQRQFTLAGLCLAALYGVISSFQWT